MMARTLLTALFCLAAVSGCYRTIRVRAAVPRPAPLASGTYWGSEGGAVLSVGVSATAEVSASIDVPAVPVAYDADFGSASGTSTSGGASLATTSSGSASSATVGSWSAAGGFSSGASTGLPAGVSTSGSGAGAGSSVDGSGDARFGADVEGLVPSLSMDLTGDGHRLQALVRGGVTIDCAAMSCGDASGSLDGAIAALGRLRPLADGALSVDALVGGDGHIRIEAALAHHGLPAAGGESDVLVRLRGGEAPDVAPPLRVHLVIDGSTSMELRWDAVRDGALALIGTLRAEDELQIVVYGSAARVALPVCPVGDGAHARRVVRDLPFGGRTNIEAGLRAAYAEAAPRGGSIVLLLSDGVPQGGAATAAELGALAAEAYQQNAVTTVAIGLGVEFHAGILQAIATNGHGDYRIAPRLPELAPLLRAEIEAHGHVVARDVEIAVALAPGVRVDADAALALGIELQEGGARIAVPALTAGAELTFALPVVVDASAVGGRVAEVSTSWSSEATAAGHATKTVAVARASGVVPAGSLGATLDLDLRGALVLAADAVLNGEAERAFAVLEAHAAEVDAVTAVHPDAPCAERSRATRAMAVGLAALVPGASWTERRSTAAAMLEWSVGLGR